MKNQLLILSFLSIIFSTSYAFSQTNVVTGTASNDATIAYGEITGTVRNSETGHVAPNVSIIVLKDGSLVTGAVADEKGKFHIEHIEAGVYDIKIVGAEFQDKLNKNIVVVKNKITHLPPHQTEMDFIPQCRICMPKVEWDAQKVPERIKTEVKWISEHILMQALGVK